jgi:spore coat protein U-like protein
MKHHCKTLAALSSSLTLALTATAGSAATATTTMIVSTSVVAACSSVSATAIAFTPVSSPVPANHDATGTISVTCSNGTGYTITLDSPSRNPMTAHLAMSNTLGGFLAYDIYAPGGVGTQLWGTGQSAATVAVPGTGTGVAQTYTATGRIVAGQTSMATGSYADQITVAVMF